LNYKQKVKRSLNDNTLNMEAKTKDEWTAFFYAAFNGYVSIVRFLANVVGCKVDGIDKFRRTPLHWAARYNNVRMIEELFQVGVKSQLVDMES
jgi:ankyrin repeat protein